MKNKIIHFGEFVRWNRVKAAKTTEALGREIGITARRLIAIEAMATPEIQHTTMAALARALGFEAETFAELWTQTPVPVTRRKSGPSTDQATRFNAACAAVGIQPAEGLRRLRSWLIEQDPATQTAALSYVPAHRQGFTDPVDHLQNPAEAVAKRIARQASRSAK